MCEIFFLKDTGNDGLSKEIIEEMLKSASLSSGSNPDGFGLFNENRLVYKSEDQFDIEDHGFLKRMYAGSEFLVLHLRMATDGEVCKKNAHPFIDGDDVMVHNGVIQTEVIDHDTKPDSYEFLKETTMWRDEEEDVGTVKAIKQTMKQAHGSVSIFFYDHNNDLYYFRDRSSFYFGMDIETDTILGATKKNRLESLLNGRRKYFEFFDIKQEPEKGNILQITDTGISKVGKFEISYGYGRNTRGTMWSTETQTSHAKYENEPDSWEEYQEKYKSEDDEKSEPHSLKPHKSFHDEEGNLMEVNF